MEKMKTTFDSKMIAAITKMASEMAGADFMEIPDSDGLVLVKIGSGAYQEREKDPSIMFYEFNDTYCVTSK
jgi:hypothetical protein